MNYRKSTLAYFLMAGLVLFTATSCSSNEPEAPSVKDVIGEYAGKATISSVNPLAEQAEGEGDVIKAMVKADSIVFSNFPVKEIVTAVVGAEEAPAVLKQIGDVAYKAAYTAVLSEKSDSVSMTIATTPLNIQFTTGEGETKDTTTIQCKLVEATKGQYVMKDKGLKVVLNATELTVNEAAFEGFIPHKADFELKKK